MEQLKLSNVDRPDRWLILGVVCLAFVVRVGIEIWRADQLLIDRDAYLGIAENLTAGRGFSSPGSTLPTAFRPPLYPLVLSVLMRVLSTAGAVAVVNLLAGCLTVWLVAQIGLRWKLGRWSYLAAFLVTIDPLLLHATPQPMTEVFFTALAAGWLWSITRQEACVTSSGKSAWKWALGTGLWFGFAALCRPTIWPLAGLMTLAWFFQLLIHGKSKEHFARAVIVVMTTALIVSPWVIRNQLRFGQPILMTTHGGYTLLLANNPVYLAEVVQQPWGTTWSGESLARWQADYEARLQNDLGENTGELARDAWMSAEGKRYIREHPRDFFQLMIHRVRCFWSIAPQGEGTNLPALIRFGVAGLYGLEFLAAVIGAGFLLRKRAWAGWLPALMLIVTIQCVHLVYWTDTRMRTPLQPVLALLAANAFVQKRRVDDSCDTSRTT